MLSVAFVCLLFIVSSPPSSSIDPETTVDTPVIDYIDDDPSFSPEQQGKQTPLIILISPIPFSLMLALDFFTVLDCTYSDA
jgi:hypothetical protein